MISIAGALGEDLRPDGVGARVGAPSTRDRAGQHHQANGEKQSEASGFHGEPPSLVVERVTASRDDATERWCARAVDGPSGPLRIDQHLCNSTQPVCSARQYLS
jgi:hypothetical protein